MKLMDEKHRIFWRGKGTKLCKGGWEVKLMDEGRKG